MRKLVLFLLVLGLSSTSWAQISGGGVSYIPFPPAGWGYNATNFNLSLTGVNPNFSLGGTGYTGATATPAIYATPNTKELILCAALGAASSGTGLAGNTCGLTEILGSQGDYMLASSWINPVYHYKSLTDSASAAGVVFSMESTAGTGLQFGTSELSATACPPGVVAAPFVPAIGSAFCSFIVAANANPLVIGMLGGTTNTLALVDWAGNGNSFFMALGGGAVPVKWAQGTSTGTNQATITLGDTNAASVTNIRGGSAANTQANGVPIVTQSLTAPTISSGFGTTPSISANNGAQSFSINVGTGGTASSGVIGLPAAAHAWACSASDTGATPTGRTDPTGPSTTTTVTLTNFSRTTGAATAWTASEIIQVSCWAN